MYTSTRAYGIKFCIQYKKQTVLVAFILSLISWNLSQRKRVFEARGRWQTPVGFTLRKSPSLPQVILPTFNQLVLIRAVWQPCCPCYCSRVGDGTILPEPFRSRIAASPLCADVRAHLVPLSDNICDTETAPVEHYWHATAARAWDNVPPKLSDFMS